MKDLNEELGRLLGTGFVLFIDKDGETIMHYPSYSTNGNAMLELIEQMIKRGWYPMPEYHPDIKKHEAFFWADNDEQGNKVKPVTAFADSFPLAITLAAYKVLSGKEWSE